MYRTMRRKKSKKKMKMEMFIPRKTPTNTMKRKSRIRALRSKRRKEPSVPTCGKRSKPRKKRKILKNRLANDVANKSYYYTLNKNLIAVIIK